MRFEFATAARIVFGPGSLDSAAGLIREVVPNAGHAVITTGDDPTRAEPLLEQLGQHGWRFTVVPVTAEPTVEVATQGAEIARRERSSLVIGMGGGSAIDAAKAIAALATNPGDAFDYLEVIGLGRPLSVPSLPCIAVPTTSGTGSEVTRNAVLASIEHKVKVSLRSPHMLPRIAIVDPELTHSLPPAVTAATGLDALTQLIEPFVCTRANPMTDAICREGIARAAGSLRRACTDSRDAGAREDMSLAALLGGLALANAGLGAVHGFAGPVGGMFPSAPHGAVCAILLPHVMAANVRALERMGLRPSLDRYREVACIVTGNEQARIEDGIQWIARLVSDLQIPGLSRYGVQVQHLDALVANAQAASSMKANPVTLPAGELRQIMLDAL